jgi:hypothetical protein
MLAARNFRMSFAVDLMAQDPIENASIKQVQEMDR